MYKRDSPAYHALVSHLRHLNETDARASAAQLTQALNLALLSGERKITAKSLAGLPTCCAEIPVLPASLALPWQAYAVSRTGIDPETDRLERILSTVPAEYAGKLPVSSDLLAPYAGSLIEEVANLIDSAKDSLLIVNPYWSIAGIQDIEMRLSITSRKEAQAILMTPYEMDRNHLAGCHYMIGLLENRGFEVEHRVPVALSNGQPVQVHAKLIIADQKMAYLGSANLSFFGLHESIEAGVKFSGTPAFHLYEWFMEINSRFFNSV